MLRNLLVLVALVPFSAIAGAEDWPCFRGPRRSGISQDEKIPVSWSAARHVKWKVALPRPGNSSPIVSRDRVFLTCALDARGYQRALLCFDRTTGAPLWSKAVRYEKADPSHPTNLYCASTPAADGQRVVAWHGSAGLFCYDYDGRELWSRTDLGLARHIWGYAASPVFHGHSIFVNFGPGAEQGLMAIDAESGRTLWKTPEPGGASSLDNSDKDTHQWVGSWGTPLAARIAGREQVVQAMPRHVQGYDPATGKVLWSVGGLSELVYTDVLIGESGIGVAMSGFTGPAIGFRLPGAEESGDLTSSHLLWQVKKNPQRIGSGVLIGEHVFMSSENMLQCIEAKTGKELWKARPDGASFWSPMVAMRGRVYATSKTGTTYVFKAEPGGFELLSKNELGEQTNACPAPADGQMFVRTFKHLWCIEEAPQ